MSLRGSLVRDLRQMDVRPRPHCLSVEVVPSLTVLNTPSVFICCCPRVFAQISCNEVCRSVRGSEVQYRACCVGYCCFGCRTFAYCALYPLRTAVFGFAFFEKVKRVSNVSKSSKTSHAGTEEKDFLSDPQPPVCPKTSWTTSSTEKRCSTTPDPYLSSRGSSENEENSRQPPYAGEA